MENFLSDPETAIRTFTALKEERDKNRALTEENRILTEKCSYLDLITGCTDAVPITVIAKDYGMSGREMNRRATPAGEMPPYALRASGGRGFLVAACAVGTHP